MPLKPLKKAVLPVAGLGTRFLPATKTMAKEMLPIVDKPLIQYAVEEARAAGIEQICLITGQHGFFERLQRHRTLPLDWSSAILCRESRA